MATIGWVIVADQTEHDNLDAEIESRYQVQHFADLSRPIEKGDNAGKYIFPVEDWIDPGNYADMTDFMQTDKGKTVYVASKTDEWYSGSTI